MNKTNKPQTELDNLLKQTLRDDLPPEVAAKMSRHFRNLKSTLNRTEYPADGDRWLWSRGIFRKEILAFASAVLLIAGGAMHLGGNQSVLAHSIEGVKTVITASSSLLRAASMDCIILRRDAGSDQPSYRVRWGASGVTRVDMKLTDGEDRTLWIPDETGPRALYAGIARRSPAIPAVPGDPAWKPALEFLTPAMLAAQMERRYGLIQTGHINEAGQDAYLLVGQENRQVVEIAVDARTYLPITLKQYQLDSSQADGKRTCLEEVRFQWNQPIPRDLLTPKPQEGNKPVNE